jgi:large subunit ribosomal protein L4
MATEKETRNENENPLVVAIFDASGERSGEAELSAAIFGATPNMAVMHQAYLRQMANRRQGTAATKTRAQVRGGGKKPYRQKGTGRARHGSTREPQMRGGGTVFGPQPRSYRQQMPRKMRRLALRSALSVKASELKISVLEGFDLEEPKTSQMAHLLQQIGIQKTALVVLPAQNQVVSRSIGNLSWAKAILAGNLNLYDIFTHDQLVIQKDALEVLEGTFAGSSAGAPLPAAEAEAAPVEEVPEPPAPKRRRARAEDGQPPAEAATNEEAKAE